MFARPTSSDQQSVQDMLVKTSQRNVKRSRWRRRDSPAKQYLREQRRALIASSMHHVA